MKMELIFFLILIGILSINLVGAPTSPNSGTQVITPSFTEPAYSDLSLKRVGDKLNITFGSEYATIRGYFFYEGSTYTFAQASSYGVTYDSWINYNTGTSSKFGGMINTSNVPQAILDNGYFVVFELVDKSEGLTYRKEGDSIYLNDNVRIIWKDYENTNNQFEVYNSTTVYLTDNGEKFHNTLIYDPKVQVANLSIGVFNNTYYNSTNGGKIQLNLTLGNGTYISQVFSINGSYNTSNLTVNSSSASGYEVEGAVKTSTFNFTEGLWAWYSFEDANFNCLYDSSGNKRHLCTPYNTTYGMFGEDYISAYANNQMFIDRKYKGIYPYGAYWENTVLVNDFDDDGEYSIVMQWNSSEVSVTDRSLMGFENDNGKTMRVLTSDEIRMDGMGCTSLQGDEYTWSSSYDIVTITYVKNATACTFFNGSSQIYTEANTTTGLIGNGLRINGIKNAGYTFYGNYSIYNILIYNQSLKPDEIQAVTNYLNRWSNWSSYQSFSSGLNTHNYNISTDSKFIQTKFKLNSDGVTSPIIYGFNITLSNYSYPSEEGEPPSDTCSPPASGRWTMTDNCTSTANVTYAGNMTIAGVKHYLAGVKHRLG